MTMKGKETQTLENESEGDSEKRLLFISHANPEDNAVAAWFATQLTLLGYEVWCDLKNARGGESAFWWKVQKKIENEAAKFIYILSNTSRDFQNKRGIYKELQAADNTGQDNFVVPLKVEKLSGSVPIIIGPDIYINSENWMEGLRELNERLEHDGVPRSSEPDIEKITSWWPSVSARNSLVKNQECQIVSNIFPFKALPEKIHFLKVLSESNPLTGYTRLKKALPLHPAHSSHSDYAISFGCAHDFLELTHGLEIEDSIVLQTQDFLQYGYAPLNIESHTARNIVTYLLATAFEKYLEDRGLRSKSNGRSPRKIWYPPNGLISNNNHSISELGARKSPVWFVGEVSHNRKKYIWHFGIRPAVDLHIHQGILFNPKVILSKPYRGDRGEAPIPVDEKKAVKKLGWQNRKWRRKILGMAACLADDQTSIRIPVGYQEIIVAAEPAIFNASQSYIEKDDEELMNELLEWQNV